MLNRMKRINKMIIILITLLLLVQYNYNFLYILPKSESTLNDILFFEGSLICFIVLVIYLGCYNEIIYIYHSADSLINRLITYGYLLDIVFYWFSQIIYDTFPLIIINVIIIVHSLILMILYILQENRLNKKGIDINQEFQYIDEFTNQYPHYFKKNKETLALVIYCLFENKILQVCVILIYLVYSLCYLIAFCQKEEYKYLVYPRIFFCFVAMITTFFMPSLFNVFTILLYELPKGFYIRKKYQQSDFYKERH